MTPVKSSVRAYIAAPLRVTRNGSQHCQRAKPRRSWTPRTRCTRAEMCTAEAAWLALAAAVLLPLRLVVGMLVLLLYYLMGRVCKLFAGRGPALPRGVE